MLTLCNASITIRERLVRCTRALAVPVFAGALTACTGGTIASFMPGQTITVEGVPFTVTDTAGGVTVRNFETGFTDPALLLSYAAIAARRVTGCPVTNITKDTGVNTYRAALDCPPS